MHRIRRVAEKSDEFAVTIDSGQGRAGKSIVASANIVNSLAPRINA
jgi:hypothetical protein